MFLMLLLIIDFPYKAKYMCCGKLKILKITIGFHASRISHIPFIYHNIMAETESFTSL